MRNGLRKAMVATVLTLVGLRVAAAPPGSRVLDAGVVRLTVEVAWGGPELPALPDVAVEGAEAVELGLSEGRVVDALAWPRGPTAVDPDPKPGPEGHWRLGAGPTGTARVRVEAPVGASLLVRAGGRVTRFPIVDLMDGPQRTLPQSPVEVRVERLAWDALEVHLAEGDGLVAPGARVPVSLGFNVLTPEPTRMAVRYSIDVRPIRGGAPGLRVEGQPEVVSTNALNPPARVVSVPMPQAEGTYVLEVRATWEPVESLEGTRLSRWLKRRRNGPPESATRRLTLAVMSAGSPAAPAPAGAAGVVDAIDFHRLIGGRPAAVGRAPAPGPGRSSWQVPEGALVEAGLRDRLRGWITRSGSEAATLPPADPSGLAWSAVGLKVPRPGRPHRLSVSVSGGHPEALGVALVVPGGAGSRPRVLLDACASGPPVGEEGAPAVFSWPVWPDAADPVLVLVNRGERAQVRVASIELAELPGDPPPAALAETHPGAPRVLSLHLDGPSALDRFGGAVDGIPADDALGMARNLAGYLAHLGASSAVLPGELASERRDRSALDGQAAEDSVGPDRLKLVLRVLERRGLTALLEVGCSGALPGLPPPGSPEARDLGLLRVDARGRVDPEGGPAYQPLNPEVREAMKRHVASAIAPRLAHPNVGGLLIRLGPGATLPGGLRSGLDDATYAAFIKAMFPADDARRLPGLDLSDPRRFEERAKFVSGPGRKPWLDWRAERVGSLYSELAEAVRAAAPGAILAVATPGLDDGPAGAEARAADRAGQTPQVAWRAVGLDLDRWPDKPGGPLVLRGSGLSHDGLARDLATNPELDAPVAARPARGLLLGAAVASPPPGVLWLSAPPLEDDEPLSHALAVLDPRWVAIDSAVAAGREERIARFARVFRALPGPSESGPPTPRLGSGVAVRSWHSGGRTYLMMANDTPYEVIQVAHVHAGADAEVDDLGRGHRLEPAAAPGGGRQLVLKLPPFGSAAARVDGPSVRVEAKETYLTDPAQLEARAEGVNERLRSLAQGEGSPGPPSPDFEPPTPRAPVAEIRAGAVAEEPVRGWSAAGDPACAIALDSERPHQGRAALRLDARAVPASVACDPFLPPGGDSLTVRAWLRADRPGALVRLWVEGEAAGRPVVRRAEVPAGTEWAERAIRVTGIPAGGLDRLRIRFEWAGLEPGTLWVDDVAVTGQGPSESGRRAQRVLTDAWHAYRLRRYADFARLIGSHRARQAAPEPAPGPVQTGRANDLPPGRRLR